MKKIRYLSQFIMATLMFIYMGSGQLAWADDVIFNPDSPSEPGLSTIKTNLVLVASPSEGGTVSGGGRSTSTSAYVYARPNGGYKFAAWTDRNGKLVSEEQNFKYSKVTASDLLIAHFVFDPDSPAEPSLFDQYFRLIVEGDDGCSVSGDGRYKPGTSVSLSARTQTSFEFVCWQDEKGNVLSEKSNFLYTMPTAPVRIRAISRFNPDAPSEPMHSGIVRATCSEGGTISTSLGNKHSVKVGEKLSLSARVNEGYEFLGWYLNGVLYTVLPSLSYTMDVNDANFNAIFRFNPTSPSEPLRPALSTYSYYFMVTNAAPGSDIDYALYLANTEVVKDIFIRVTFPAGLKVDVNSYQLSDKAEGYTVTMCEAEDELSLLEEGSHLYDFSLIGGETQPGTQALLSFKVSVPDDIETCKKQQTKINQISMQQADGSAVTAHTRNGVIAVYKKGDANGDDRVSVADIVAMLILNNKGEAPKDFIPEVSDLNSDGILTEEDLPGIIEIALGKE